MWSRSTEVTTAQSASKTLTASSRPPSPTSSITTSTAAPEKASHAARVPNSKYVREASPRAASTFAKEAHSTSSEAGRPSMRTRSL